jgi:hypothetical protein
VHSAISVLTQLQGGHLRSSIVGSDSDHFVSYSVAQEQRPDVLLEVSGGAELDYLTGG